MTPPTARAGSIAIVRTKQWEWEVRTPTGDESVADAWGIAGGIHLARSRELTGCCAAERRPNWTAGDPFPATAVWRWCGMPIAFSADLAERDGIEPFFLCLHHAVRVSAAAGYIPIEPAATIGTRA